MLSHSPSLFPGPVKQMKANRKLLSLDALCPHICARHREMCYACATYQLRFFYTSAHIGPHINTPLLHPFPPAVMRYLAGTNLVLQPKSSRFTGTSLLFWKLFIQIQLHCRFPRQKLVRINYCRSYLVKICALKVCY